MTKEKSIPRKVLLFSGGTDSVMAAYLYKPDILLHIDVAGSYSIGDEVAAHAVHREFSFLYNLPLTTIRAHCLAGFERRDDKILPLRNLYFVMLASHYGDTIILGAMGGDRVLDKSYEFASLTSELLSYLYSEQHWCIGRDIKIELPMKKFTKVEVMRQYLAANGPITALLEASSCYAPNVLAPKREGWHCGWCKSCLRKWVAMECNGVEYGPSYFARDPLDSPLLISLFPEIQQGRHRSCEDSQWISAIQSKIKRDGYIPQWMNSYELPNSN